MFPSQVDSFKIAILKVGHLKCRAFDRQGDGRIAIEDVKIFLRHFGDLCSEPEIEGLIVKFDENKNGFFEKREFINFLSFVQY